MYLFSKVLPLDSTPVTGTRELWLCLGVKLQQTIHLPVVYFIKSSLCYYTQQKPLQNRSSLQQMIIILLIGLNILKLESKREALLPLFSCAGKVDMCAEAGALRPGPLSFLFSYQRPHTYQFQISQEQRERETTDRKGIFFFYSPLFPLARLTECLHLSHFTEESNYSSGLTYKDKPSNLQKSTPQKLNWVQKHLNAERTSQLID